MPPPSTHRRRARAQTPPPASQYQSISSSYDHNNYHSERANSAPRSIHGRYQHAREWNNNTSVRDTPSIALKRQGRVSTPRMHYGRHSPPSATAGSSHSHGMHTHRGHFPSPSGPGGAAVNSYGQLLSGGMAAAATTTPFGYQDDYNNNNGGYDPYFSGAAPASTATRIARHAVPGTTRGSIRIARDPASFSGR